MADLAQAAGLALMPHSPSFGPGYLAALHLAATRPGHVLLEYLHVFPKAWLYPDMPLPVAGWIACPCRSGLGMDPDADVIARYRVGGGPPAQGIGGQRSRHLPTARGTCAQSRDRRVPVVSTYSRSAASTQAART